MRLLDALFAARPLVLVPAWSFFLLGAAHHSTPGFPLLRFILLSLILVATHLLNQVVDFESDRLNNKGFFLQQGIFSARQYVVVSAVLLSTALGISYAEQDGALLLTLAALLGLAYNLPPPQLSHRPVFDVLANALGYGSVAYLLGHGGALSTFPWMHLLATSGAVAAVFLHTTLLDIEGDRQQGKLTTGAWLGNRPTRALAAVVATSALLAAWMTSHSLLWIPCAVLALLAWSANSLRISVWGAAVFAVAAAVSFWWFGVAMLLLVLLTRVYYKRRFDLQYPSF